MTEHVRLKRLATLMTRCDVQGERPYVALEHLESETGRLLADVELPVRAAEEPGLAAVEPGDVLFGKLRPYLAKTWLADRQVFASTELLCLRPQRHVHSKWLAFLCQSRPVVEWAIATSDGAKMPRTSWDRLRDYVALVPPLSAQRAIADHLGRETIRIDALIAAKKRMADLLEERWQATLEQAIQAATARFAPQPLKYACREIVVGIVITPSAWYAEEGVPAIRGLNVAPGRISEQDLVFLTPEGDELHRKSRLRPGDIVIVRTGQAGASAVVPPSLDGANCIDLVIARPKVTLDSFYLEAVLNSDWMQKHIEEHSVGSIQSHFNVGAAKAVKIPLPSPDEQKRVVAMLHRASAARSATVAALEHQIAALQEHRQAIITAAVTGELIIPEAA